MNTISSRRWSTEVSTDADQFRLKRHALIREAGKAFSKNGFHNTSLSEVAATLNVTKTALYYYVKDKNEILLECHNIALDLGDQALHEAKLLDKSAFETLLFYAFRYMQLLTSELGNCAVLTEPLTSLREAERQIVERRLRFHDAQLRLWVRDGISAGEIRLGEPAVLVAFMMGAINYIPTWMNPKGKVSGDDVAQIYIDLIRSALKA